MSARGWRRLAGVLAGVLVAVLWVLRPLLQLVEAERRRQVAEEHQRQLRAIDPDNRRWYR